MTQYYSNMVVRRRHRLISISINEQQFSYLLKKFSNATVPKIMQRLLVILESAKIGSNLK